MTPIYRSPDYNQTKAIQALLLENNIQTSIIETKKSAAANGSTNVTWHELWLHSYADITRAKTMITQHEFTTFKTNMNSNRPVVQEQPKLKFHNTVESIAVTDTAKNNSNINHPATQEQSKVKFQSTVESIAVTNTQNARPEKDTAPDKNTKNLIDDDPEAETTRPREDLIPINNKRVFKRLGLLLGFSEEEINKFEAKNNKLYRPWDAGTLMERVKNLKQKCS